MLTRTKPTTAVLPFQLPGCAYQPPAGDQTCLGYLGAVSGQRAGGRGMGGRRLRDLSSSAHCEVQVWRYLGVGVAAG